MVILPPPDPNAPSVFLDTSVIISGILSRQGASHAILTLCELGLLRLVVCPYILDEATNNLSVYLPEIAARFQELRVSINWETIPDPSADQLRKWQGIVPDKDLPVLAAAIIANPSQLVTLDTKHFVRPIQVAEKSSLKLLHPVC